MAEIANPVVFSIAARAAIDDMRSRPSFSHQDWGSDELEHVRSEIRNHYRMEQRFSCAYCQHPVSQRSAAGSPVEHIASKSAYPQFIFEPRNLCVVCPDCNEFKRSREVLVEPVINRSALRKYPDNTDRFRIFHPHFDTYLLHIQRAGVLYFPRSAKGSYTAYVCNLFRFVEHVGMTTELLNDLSAVVERHRFHNR